MFNAEFAMMIPLYFICLTVALPITLLRVYRHLICDQPTAQSSIEKNLSIKYGFPSGTRLMGIICIHLMIYSLVSVIYQFISELSMTDCIQQIKYVCAAQNQRHVHVTHMQHLEKCLVQKMARTLCSQSIGMQLFSSLLYTLTKKEMPCQISEAQTMRKLLKGFLV